MAKQTYETSLLGPCLITWGSLSGPTRTDYPFPGISLPTKNFSLVDEKGPRGALKNCTHLKIASFYPSTSLYGRVPSWDSWMSCLNPAATFYSILHNGIWEPQANPRPKGFQPIVSLGDLSFEALESMSPSMKQNVSLSNFLFELGDVKQMFHLWSKHRSTIYNLASLDLNWNFGWKPFVSDLRKIFLGMLTFEDRLADFIRRSGVPNRRHFQRTVSLDPVITDGTDYFMSGTTQIYKKYETVYSNCSYHALMDYAYTLRKMSYQRLRILAMLDTLGLTLYPSQIWEAIPWSFVIDWFVNVGSYLESYESSMVDPELSIVGFMHSLKYECTQNLSYRMFGSSGNAWYDVASHEITSYQRAKSRPKTVKSLDGTLQFFSDLTKVRLAASLLLTR